MMLHFQSKSGTGQEHQMPLNDLEDFEAVVKLFPQVSQALYRHHDLRRVAQDMVSYLGNHHIDAWLTEQ